MMVDTDMLTLVGFVAVIATAFSAALCKAMEWFTNGKAMKKINKIGMTVVGMEKKMLRMDAKVNKIEAMVKADMMVSMNVIDEYGRELDKWYHPVYQELADEKLKGCNGNGN